MSITAIVDTIEEFATSESLEFERIESDHILLGAQGALAAYDVHVCTGEGDMVQLAVSSELPCKEALMPALCTFINTIHEQSSNCNFVFLKQSQALLLRRYLQRPKYVTREEILTLIGLAVQRYEQYLPGLRLIAEGHSVAVAEAMLEQGSCKKM